MSYVSSPSFTSPSMRNTISFQRTKINWYIFCDLKHNISLEILKIAEINVIQKRLYQKDIDMYFLTYDSYYECPKVNSIKLFVKTKWTSVGN